MMPIVKVLLYIILLQTVVPVTLLIRLKPEARKGAPVEEGNFKKETFMLEKGSKGFGLELRYIPDRRGMAGVLAPKKMLARWKKGMEDHGIRIDGVREGTPAKEYADRNPGSLLRQVGGLRPVRLTEVDGVSGNNDAILKQLQVQEPEAKTFTLSLPLQTYEYGTDEYKSLGAEEEVVFLDSGLLETIVPTNETVPAKKGSFGLEVDLEKGLKIVYIRGGVAYTHRHHKHEEGSETLMQEGNCIVAVRKPGQSWVHNLEKRLQMLQAGRTGETGRRIEVLVAKIPEEFQPHV